MTTMSDHHVHGLDTGLEPPAWPPIAPAEAEAVLVRFPAAGRLVALRWHSPRPFSAAALVEAGGGGLLLKRHHRRLRPPEALAEEHRFVGHLRAAGVPVPDILSADDGTTAVSDREWTFELHRRAPGLDLYRDRPSWTPFLSRQHAHAAGAALARLHRAARDYAARARPPRPLVASLTILSAPDPLAAAEAFVAARPALAAFLSDRPWRRGLERLFATWGDGLAARLAARPPLWTHGDWHPSNLLWGADDAVRTVLDFGLADRTCALHDLALAIERGAVRWLEMGRGPDGLADTQAALALVAGYRSVLPLSADDLLTLAHLLPLVHVEFALSEIDYFHGLLARPDQALVAWRDYLLGHAAWFATPAGRDLLARVAAC